MAWGEGTAIIGCSPRKVLEFVLDVERYRLAFTLTPWSRLDFEMVTAPWPLAGFDGWFTCEQTAHGTRVVHRECFTLHPLAGPLDPVIGAWLARDTPREVTRIKGLLERDPRS
jgi:hypothetical protein